MTKEEIKEMIDATINENGQGNITGKALNLALNSIIDTMGEGGGLDTIYVVSSTMNPDNPVAPETLEAVNPYYIYSEDEIRAMIAHNKNIYNKITEKFNNTKNASSFVFDFSAFLTMDHGALFGCNIGIKQVIYLKVEEQAPTALSASFNPYDYYNAGETMVIAALLDNRVLGGQQIAILPNGICEIIYNVG